MQIGDHYKGFVITWVEPPVSAHEWVLNINAKDKNKAGLTKFGRAEVIKGAATGLLRGSCLTLNLPIRQKYRRNGRKP